MAEPDLEEDAQEDAEEDEIPTLRKVAILFLALGEESSGDGLSVLSKIMRSHEVHRWGASRSISHFGGSATVQVSPSYRVFIRSNACSKLLGIRIHLSLYPRLSREGGSKVTPLVERITILGEISMSEVSLIFDGKLKSIFTPVRVRMVGVRDHSPSKIAGLAE